MRSWISFHEKPISRNIPFEICERIQAFKEISHSYLLPIVKRYLQIRKKNALTTFIDFACEVVKDAKSKCIVHIRDQEWK